MTAAAIAEPIEEERGLQPTELTHGVLNALDRPAVASITPTTIGTLVTGMATAGIYPAYALPHKWERALRWHQNILWHLSEWAMVNVGVEQGGRMHQQTRSHLPRALARLATVCSLVALGTAAVGVSVGVPLSSFWLAGPFPGQPILITFNAALLGAYVLTWLSVNAHLRGLHRARQAVLQNTEQLPPTPGLPLARLELGVRPVATGLGVLLFLAGFWWALPMMIATTAQRRALLMHNRRHRTQTAQRVRLLIDGRRPVTALPPVIDRVGVCSNAVCDEVLPPDARFCARCGMPQRPISRMLD